MGRGPHGYLWACDPAPVQLVVPPRNRLLGTLSDLYECPPYLVDEILIAAVNAAVGTPPIYNAMKVLARQIMISTAEKKGVAWKQNIADLERSEVWQPRRALCRRRRPGPMPRSAPRLTRGLGAPPPCLVFAPCRLATRTRSHTYVPPTYVLPACHAPRLQVFSIREELENPDVTYPSYYRQPFHAYREGNLSWKAAFEVRPPASGRGG